MHVSHTCTLPRHLSQARSPAATPAPPQPLLPRVTLRPLLFRASSLSPSHSLQTLRTVPRISGPTATVTAIRQAHAGHAHVHPVRSSKQGLGPLTSHMNVTRMKSVVRSLPGHAHTMVNNKVTLLNILGWRSPAHGQLDGTCPEPLPSSHPFITRLQATALQLANTRAHTQRGAYKPACTQAYVHGCLSRHSAVWPSDQCPFAQG